MRMQNTATAKATATPVPMLPAVAPAPQPPAAASAVLRLWFTPNATTEKVLAKGPGSSRYATCYVAQQYSGQPVSVVQAMWVQAMQFGLVHSARSVFTQGTSKQNTARQWPGRLGYLTGAKSGGCCVVSATPPKGHTIPAPLPNVG